MHEYVAQYVHANVCVMAHCFGYFHRMGIVIVRHLKRLEMVIVGYLEISDCPEETTRLAILAALEKTIQVAWPRYINPNYIMSLNPIVIACKYRKHLSKAFQLKLYDNVLLCLSGWNAGCLF